MNLLQIIINIIEAIKNSPTSVSFLSIKEYTSKQSGEVSNVLVNVGVSYENAKAKDIKYLSELDVTTLESKIYSELLEEARTALLKSLLNPSKARSQGQKDAYINIAPNVRYHKESQKIHVYGMSESKTVLVKGTYKKVNKRDLTIAKDFLRKNLKTSKFRTYIVENAEKMKVNGNTIEL